MTQFVKWVSLVIWFLLLQTLPLLPFLKAFVASAFPFYFPVNLYSDSDQVISFLWDGCVCDVSQHGQLSVCVCVWAHKCCIRGLAGSHQHVFPLSLRWSVCLCLWSGTDAHVLLLELNARRWERSDAYFNLTHTHTPHTHNYRYTQWADDFIRPERSSLQWI